MADIKLFTRPTNNTPSDSQKLVFGDGTAPEENITFGNFATYLMSKLGFFKVTNLFSEIFGNPTATATAQNNLDVYGKTAINGALNLVAYKDNVIEKNTTTPFTPILSTHPLNKGYVDGKIQGGTVLINGIASGASSYLINLPIPMSDTNYVIVATVANFDLFASVKDARAMVNTATNFNIALFNSGADITGQFYVSWIAYKL